MSFTTDMKKLISLRNKAVENNTRENNDAVFNQITHMKKEYPTLQSKSLK
jgi:hypothetical protein